MTCLEEHDAYHDDPHLGCHLNREYFRLPTEYKLYARENALAECNNNNNGEGGVTNIVFLNDDDGGSIASKDSLLATFELSNNTNRMREFRGAVESRGQRRKRDRNGGSTEGNGGGGNQRKTQRSTTTTRSREVLQGSRCKRK